MRVRRVLRKLTREGQNVVRIAKGTAYDCASHVAGTAKRIGAKARRGTSAAFGAADTVISPGTYLRYAWTPDQKEGKTLRVYVFATLAAGCFGVVAASLSAALLGTVAIPSGVLMAASATQYVMFGDDHFKAIMEQMPTVLGFFSWSTYLGLIGLSGVGVVKHGLVAAPSLVKEGSSLLRDGLVIADGSAAAKSLGHLGLGAFRCKTAAHNLYAFFRRTGPSDLRH